MKSTIDLLDRAKALIGKKSHYALAKALGISAGSVRNYYEGSTHPDDTICVTLAELLQLPLHYVLAVVALNRNRYSLAVAGWQALYELARRDAEEGGEL